MQFVGIKNGILKLQINFRKYLVFLARSPCPSPLAPPDSRVTMEVRGTSVGKTSSRDDVRTRADGVCIHTYVRGAKECFKKGDGKNFIVITLEIL